MIDVVYIGGADTRMLSGADFEQLGVSHDGEAFHRGEAVEVSNELGKVLLEAPELHGEFIAAEHFEKRMPALAAQIKASQDPDTSGLLANIGNPDSEQTEEVPGSNDANAPADGDAGSTNSTASNASGSTAKASSKSTGRSK